MKHICGKCDEETQLVAAEEYEVPKNKLGTRVVIVGGVVKRIMCPKCGEVGIEIPDLPGLIAAAAVARVRKPWKLSPDEIKFLRKALEMNAKEFAGMMDVAPETVSRWENAKAVMGPTAERVLRMNVGIRLDTRAPGVKFDQKEIADMKIQAAFVPESMPPLRFRRVEVVTTTKDDELAWRDERKAA
jgi:transcriptional regulator with XRE-family HTH domain